VGRSPHRAARTTDLADAGYNPIVGVGFSYAASNEAIEKGIARMTEFIVSNTKVKKIA